MADKIVKRGKPWFMGIKGIAKLFYKKPKFLYLGEEFSDGSIILSNHEGSYSPLTLEIWMNRKIRFWGTYEMNSGLKELYRYQTRIYYHQKKGWNLWLARIVCLIVSPLTNLFYKGLNLISTYRDTRFMKTIKTSINAVKNGESIIIFPEDSSKGYYKELTMFFSGFAFLAQTLAKKGIDAPIVVSYFRREEKIFVIDKPIKYSELLAKYGDKDNIAKNLLDRCNLLGKMDLTPHLENK